MTRDRSLLFCGDTFLMAKGDGEPFSHVLPLFQEHTVCLNLETALEGETLQKKIVALCVKEEALDRIPESLQILSLVNNHVGDGGDPRRLAAALEQRGKTVIGPENPAYARREMHGVPAGFFSAYFRMPRFRISYNGHCADRLEAMLRQSGDQLKIVNLHWGYEHTLVPAPFQRKLARRLIDAGADIIIGHHPHVAQGWECYKGKWIFYSLGNFNFWQFDIEPTQSNKWGYMVRFDLNDRAVRPIFYKITEEYKPCLMDAQERQSAKEKLEDLSRILRDTGTREWLNCYYRTWHMRERKAWAKHLKEIRSLSLIVKWAVWFVLPLQIAYYLRRLIGNGHGRLE